MPACQEILRRALVAEFAERELAGKSIPEGLKAVEHHLSICADCRDEYETLRQALKVMEGAGERAVE